MLREERITSKVVYVNILTWATSGPEDAWLKHEQSHWLHTEVLAITLAEDVKDWKHKLSSEEKQFLTHIFRFFTQGDIDVAGGYVKNYLPYFPQPEVRMMLSGLQIVKHYILPPILI